MAARKSPSLGSKPDREWRDAVRVAVHELRAEPGSAKKIRVLRLLAEKLVTRALDGDMSAIKEIGDRLDGRPAQTTVLEGGDNAVRVSFEMNVPRE